MVRSPAESPLAVRRLGPGDRPQVLAVLDRLLARVEAIDLNTVDGEFFWRCCCPGLSDRLDALRAAFLSGAADDDFFLVHAEAELLGEHRVPRPVTYYHLTQGDPLCLRLPEFRLKRNAAYVDDELEITVTSAAWTGRQIAEIAGRRLADEERDPFAMLPTREPDVLESHIRCSLDLGPPVTATVLIALPMPPLDAIAATYDAFRTTIGRAHLPPANGRDNRAALRTWATRLLMNSGLTYSDALNEIGHDRLVRLIDDAKLRDKGGVTEEADRQLRNALIRRVPEAELFLA